jgi:hypothetical protein
MNFMLRERWCCSFLEEDLKTTLPRKVRFETPEQMVAFAERGGAVLNLEDRQAFEHGLSIGRGGIWLNLNMEQYATLRDRGRAWQSRLRSRRGRALFGDSGGSG